MSWLKRGFSLAFIQALVTRHLRITISRARLLQSLLVSRLVCCLSVADGKGTIHKQARNLPSCNHTYNFSRNHLSTDLNRRSRVVEQCPVILTPHRGKHLSEFCLRDIRNDHDDSHLI